MFTDAGFRVNRMDVLLTAGAAMFGVGDSLTRTPAGLVHGPWQPAALAGTGSLLLLLRRRLPLTVAGLGAALNCLVNVPAQVVFGVFAAGMYGTSLPGLAAACSLVLAPHAMALRDGATGTGARSLLYALTSTVGTALAGLLYQQHLAAVEARAAAYDREREQACERARVAERCRIAREMHDVVAHQISLVAVEAGALEVTADRGPAWTTARAGSIRQGCRDALHDLRQILGVLTTGEPEATPLSPQPSVQDLPRLAGELRAAGLPIRLTVTGARRPLPAMVELTAYRLIQEALTGGHAAAAHVTLLFQPGTLAIRVAISAVHPMHAAPPGERLRGLHERVAVLGGTIHSRHRRGGGLLISAILPARTTTPRRALPTPATRPS